MTWKLLYLQPSDETHSVNVHNKVFRLIMTTSLVLIISLLVIELLVVGQKTQLAGRPVPSYH